jgi:hypothetical protein
LAIGKSAKYFEKCFVVVVVAMEDFQNRVIPKIKSGGLPTVKSTLKSVETDGPAKVGLNKQKIVSFSR